MKKLIDFFNVYDENGVYHNGFLQSIDLSAYTDFDFLNEVTMNLMDMFLHNEIGLMLTSGRWNSFLHWDKESGTYKINSEFYDSAKYSIYAYLIKTQKFFELTQIDYKSFSATEMKTISYGLKETENDYDKVVVEINRENDTTQYGQNQRTLLYGQNQRTLLYGATQQTNLYGATSETNSIGQQINSSTNTHSKHPFDLSANTYLGDTKDENSVTNGSRQDGKSTTSHTDTISELTHTDTDTTATRTDTDTVATHTDTNTYGDITNTTDARKDTVKIKAHIDTETKTKVVILSPDKFFEIEKELINYGVYNLLLESVKHCFTIQAFM